MDEELKKLLTDRLHEEQKDMITTMDLASKVGDKYSSMLREVANDEKKHRNIYQAILDDMEGF